MNLLKLDYPRQKPWGSSTRGTEYQRRSNPGQHEEPKVDAAFPHDDEAIGHQPNLKRRARRRLIHAITINQVASGSMKLSPASHPFANNTTIAPT